MIRSHLVTDFLLPTRILAKEGDFQDLNLLLEQEEDQVFMTQQRFCSVKGKGYLLLDFGQELQGGVRILMGMFPNDQVGGHIRLRFGESASEAYAELYEKNTTNNHSLRDFSFYMPDRADQSFGQTGFRFVRIDFLDDIEYRIVNIYAAYQHRDLEAIGSFESDDARLNAIFATAEHTLFLNCQENLFEGIKRDRCVWVGDMMSETLAYSYLYDDPSIIEDAIHACLAHSPLPSWCGNIPSYTAWLMLILRNYWKGYGKRGLVDDCWEYLSGIVSELNDCVLEDGSIDYSRGKAKARQGYFLDWPSQDTPDSKAGNRYAFLLGLSAYEELSSALCLTPSPYVDSIRKRLCSVQEDPHAKQVVALGYLAGQIEPSVAKERLFQGGAHGLSTFLSYFIFKAMARLGTMEETLSVLKDYYGAMLDVGATSFFEAFDLDWLEGSGRIDELTKPGQKDLHGDHGAHCYIGFRHSLCHGWSVGPISFLLEDVLGYRRDGAAVSFSPNLGPLKKLHCVVRSPYGPVSIDVEGGKADVHLPEGMTIQAE